MGTYYGDFRDPSLEIIRPSLTVDRIRQKSTPSSSPSTHHRYVCIILQVSVRVSRAWIRNFLLREKKICEKRKKEKKLEPVFRLDITQPAFIAKRSTILQVCGYIIRFTRRCRIKYIRGIFEGEIIISWFTIWK